MDFKILGSLYLPALFASTKFDIQVERFIVKLQFLVIF